MKIESAKELAVYGAAYKLAMDVFHLTEHSLEKRNTGSRIRSGDLRDQSA